MGAQQSSTAKVSTVDKLITDSSVRGRKSNTNTPGLVASNVSIEEGFVISGESNFTASLEEDDVTEESSLYDSDEEEEDEDEEERLRILEDARSLKRLSGFYLHPDAPVAVDGTVKARCFFNRFEALEGETVEEAEERALALADTKALKKLAVDFIHPEKPVVVDPEVFGRNYFDRASAEPQESVDQVEERSRILEEAKALKKLATDFMHPAYPVVIDSEVFGRNYFDRASAVEQDSVEDATERQRALQDAKALKKLAVDFMHAEKPVVVEPEVFGRNYFDRASAERQESFDEVEGRSRILEEAKALKKLAVDFMHPAYPVVVDSEVFGRNYFGRASAEPQESFDEAEERSRILAEAKALRNGAVDFMHPEKPLAVDPEVFGRNYFDRFSATPQVDAEQNAERDAVLADVRALQKLARGFMYPADPIETDGFARGRNYFSRPSAEPQEEVDYDKEHGLIVADAKALKKRATDFMHPEKPVVVDSEVFGRNYFGRASAEPQESIDEAEERSRILAAAKALKNRAVDFMHPEKPVAVDPEVFVRNFFDRYSAIPHCEEEEAAEREALLAETKLLKKLAFDFLHPEKGISTTDPTACACNYFDRPSALGHNQMIHTFPEHEEDEHHHEHLDHFGMDEDMDARFDDFRQQFQAIEGGTQIIKQQGDEEEGGNLSRSPSSVMLFTEESIYD